jgi:Holliday junction resolvasome RuvABC ATP-dependent DNA helicase subunit
MFDKLIGQAHIKRELSFYVKGYKASKLTPFLMFNGAAGLGKTEFAKAFAKELKKPLLEINCSTIRSNQQFFEQIFMPLIGQEITFLFDEAHALPRPVQNAFLTVFNVDGAKRRRFEFDGQSFEFDFEKQSYIFATTEQDKIFEPLKKRFDIIDFVPYTDKELGEIVQLSADFVKFEDGVLESVSSAVRGNARSAVKMAKKIVMFCEAQNTTNFTAKNWKDVCFALGIKPSGLTNSEIEVLNILKTRGSCTLNMLSAATGNSRTVIQRDIEMFLLRKGYMKIDGTRQITGMGLKVLEEVAAK